MRKFLMVAAVGALALLMAVPASAMDFKFSGEWRVRFYDGVNIGFNKDAAPNTAFANTQVGPNARGAQIRIRPRFDASDDNGNVQAVWRIEVGDVEFGGGGGAFNNTNFGNPIGAGTARIGNGAGGGGGADGINVETKWAYLDFAMPWGVPARVRAGIQPWYLPKGMIVDDDVAGVSVYGKTGMVSYQAAWWRPSSGPATNPALAGAVMCNTAGVITAAATAAACTGGGGTVVVFQSPVAPATLNTTDNNYDVYQIKLDAALMEAFNPGIYFLYADNRINCDATEIAAFGGTQCNAGVNRTRSSYYFGFTTTGKIGIANYDFDFIYGTAEGGPSGAFGGVNGPIQVSGFALDAHVGFPIGPVVVNLAGSYASGDKRNGGNSEAFPGGFAPGWNGPGGGFEMLGSGGPFDAVEFTQDGMTNLWALGLWLEYRPVKALWLKAAYAYAAFAKGLGNCSVANANPCYGPAYAGKGVDPIAGKSRLGQEISFRADYDVWTNFKIQGQMGWFVPSGGDTASEYVLQLLYNF